MADLTLSRAQLQKAVTFRQGLFLGRAVSTARIDTIKWFIRYAFYAFIFSLPFEELDIGIGATLPKLFGIALAALALVQMRLCYEFPPKAFWCFAVYLAIFVVSGSYLLLFPPNVPDFTSLFIASVLRLGQLLVLFWISYNLLKQERVVNGILWALATATILLAALQIFGITGAADKTGRVSAFEANPNGLATILALGLLSLFGLGYGREKQDWKGRLLFWLGSGILVLAMVQTGSRGAVVAVVGSLSIFFLRGKSLANKLKFGLIALAGIIVLAIASYQIDAVRKRWEQTFYDESLAGRERIYPAAVGMILESPFIGWGPINHLWELGPRIGLPSRDEHNVYLWILAEVGLLGAIPFFAGLWLCWRAAWRARHSIQGILPLVMLLFILASSMKGTFHNRKYFWAVLSFALAAGSYTAGSQRSRIAVSYHPGSGAMRRRHNLVNAPLRSRPRRFSRSSYPRPRT